MGEGMTAALKFAGTRTLSGLTSTRGLFILAVILSCLGFPNILIIAFDTVARFLDIFSGAELYKTIMTGAVDTHSPVFFIYISVFVISFVFAIGIFIVGTVKQTSTGLGQSEGGKSLAWNRIKWSIIWLVGLIAVPVIMTVFIVFISLIAGIINIPVDKINFTNISPENYSVYINTLTEKINQSINQVDNLIAYLKPDKVPNGFSEEDWNKLLATPEYTSLVNNLITSKTYLSSILSLTNDASIDKVGTSYEYLAQQLNQINSQISHLIGLDLSVDNNKSPFVAFLNQYNVIFTEQTGPVKEWIDKLTGNLKTYGSGADSTIYQVYYAFVNGIQFDTLMVNYNSLLSNGITGMVIKHEGDFWNTKPITNLISYMLYGQAITDPWAFTEPFGLLKHGFAHFLEYIFAMFALSKVLEVFLSLLLNLGKQQFMFMSLTITAPFATASGINDDGGKFKMWFKSAKGKAFIIFFTILFINLYGAVLAPLTNVGEILLPTAGIDGFQYGIMSGLLKGAIVYALGLAISEATEWSASWFETDTS